MKRLYRCCKMTLFLLLVVCFSTPVIAQAYYLPNCVDGVTTYKFNKHGDLIVRKGRDKHGRSNYTYYKPTYKNGIRTKIRSSREGTCDVFYSCDSEGKIIKYKWDNGFWGRGVVKYRYDKHGYLLGDATYIYKNYYYPNGGLKKVVQKYIDDCATMTYYFNKQGWLTKKTTRSKVHKYDYTEKYKYTYKHGRPVSMTLYLYGERRPTTKITSNITYSLTKVSEKRYKTFLYFYFLFADPDYAHD